MALQDALAQKMYKTSFAQAGQDGQAVINQRVKDELRRNTYDTATGNITISTERAAVVRTLAAHYTSLFGEQYAMTPGTLRNPQDLQALPAFFFWSAWAAATDRPEDTQLSYTSNWPHEPLVNNVPTTGNGIWSIASVILLIAGVAVMIAFHSTHQDEGDPTPPRTDPLFDLKPTPSMRATVPIRNIRITARTTCCGQSPDGFRKWITWIFAPCTSHA